MAVLGLIRTVVGQIVGGAGSVVGYRGGTKEPDYSAEKLTRAVDIRHYGARLAAETTVAAGETAARNTGFRRLARYIFGANQANEKIAMTAPVVQQSGSGQGEKIAMTVPVSQKSAGDGEWVIRFFMPADKSLESLPRPDDAEVRLVNVPPETVAVRRFAGSPTRSAVASQTVELMKTLRESDSRPPTPRQPGSTIPPWTVPALRRNEIAVSVQPTN